MKYFLESQHFIPYLVTTKKKINTKETIKRNSVY